MSHRETNNLASPWRFRDGTEYLVSILISDKPKWASISLQDKVTAEEWSGQFDLKYIENLTQRTGSFKSFDVFVAMIKSAILKKSDAVSLDLMSYDDLVTLKTNKSRMGTTGSAELNLGPNFAKFDANSDAEIYGKGPQANRQSSKYLIVTYTAEFDKVHYPLPLKYTGYPDATVMQQTIQKLKTEVSQLKQTNTDLKVQLQSVIKGPRRHNNNLKDETDAETDYSDMEITGPNNKNGSLRSDRSHEKVLEGLATLVKQLETRIENERLDHKEHVAKLEAENEYLRNKVKAIEMTESALKEKVTRLESVLAMNVGLKRANNNGKPTGKQPLLLPDDETRDLTPKESYLLARAASLNRTGRSKVRGASIRRNISNSSRGSSIGSERDRSRLAGAAPIRLNDSGTLRSAASSRQSSCERRPFNPTEYVKQKKLKQEQMAQLRMARVESRIHTLNTGRRQQQQQPPKKAQPERPESAVISRKEVRELRSARRRASSIDSNASDRGNNNTVVFSRNISSPTPSRRTSLTNIPGQQKNTKSPMKVNVVTYSSYDKMRSQKNGRTKSTALYQESHGRFRNVYKTERTGNNSAKSVDSSLSFEKLQKRLHTIHGFLDMNRK